ncbi:RNA polymerase sigma factor [Actinomadura mexicana]|uniref:RNA polymerase sigma factor, sigma-70 family n=1 Tax=Actinomadura mexicana TaxID=134959 RepID=A0A238UTS4_9ACTN|nr:sigma-70 family RNA polymerase sigma factor [Actinomadura mexicana]SNR25580.1 RNA polymerase sigma factor, sigma-70 family [Actinomadura mexicana]
MSGWPSLDRADDERLARTLAAGDPSALIQVMDRYAARLYDYCHALLRDQDQAAGALHDALIAAYAHVSGLREPDRFRGWLYSLVRNECMRRLRDPDRPARRHEAPEAEDGFLDEAELARRQEARRLVHAALSGLRGRERESLDLMLRHGLDADEIGGVLGMDAQQATGLTAEARARLDDSLAAAYIARAGRDDCPEAAAIADDAGWPLPPPVVHRLVQHIEACGVCGPRRDRTVSAVRLLQVLPVAMTPNDLRGRVMATATDPALAPDLAAIAQAARPFDDWGWPAMVEQEPVRATSGGAGGGRRGVWAALAAAAAVIAVVAAAYYLMSGTSGEPPAAQGPSDGTSASAVSPSSPAESQEPSDTPTPTRSATPTPTTTSPTPTPTKTRRPSRSPSPTATRTQPRAGRLSIGSCAIEGAGPGSCTITVRAVGGTATWSVTGASGGLSASGGGTLRSGQSGYARVSGTCTPPGGSGTVSFSNGDVRTVTLSCPPEDGGRGPG